MAQLKYDIIGLGCAAVDDLVYVAAYPPPDAKVPIVRRGRQCGGLTATALVAAARLGSACAFAGALGDGELTAFVLERLRAEGIDVSHVVRREGARPVHAIIVVDETHNTRNVFFGLDGVLGADPREPPAEVLRSARVLFVDSVGVEGQIRAARIARDAHVPVVADFEHDRAPRAGELLDLIDHLIVSEVVAARVTGAGGAAEATAALGAADDRKTVVVTCGHQGAWYAGEGHATPRHQPACKVPVVDTTGCGDVFHGAYASALARGVALPERVRFASAAAALKATVPGGQAGIPTRTAVEEFLRRG